MDVSRDSGASRCADVHAEIDSVWLVELPQDGFCLLREIHHLLRGFRRELLQLIDVGVGYDHDVAGRVRKSIQDHEAMLATIDDAGFLIIAQL